MEHDKSGASGLSGHRIGLLGLPFDFHSSYLRGAARAPDRIRKALACESTNCWSELGVDVGDAVVDDAGDLTLGSPEAFHRDIAASIRDIAAKGLKPFSLGGDHAVTYPIVSALAEVYPKLTIVQFDAHPDLYDNFEDNPYSHASPFARIMEAGLANRLVQVGIRTMNDHQRKQVARFGVEVIEMRRFDEHLVIRSDDPVYLSFDMDGLDPAFAPGVSHPEPGGLSTRQALKVIHAIEGAIIGADIVEYNPTRDIHDMTAGTAAKLCKEIIAKMVLA